MNHQFQVLSSFQNGVITGNLSPMMAAQDLAKRMNEQLIAVLRVNFRNEDGSNNKRLFQEYEEGGYTGFDHLLVCFPNWSVFIVDRGTRIEIIAGCYPDNEVEVLITASDRSMYSRSLTNDEIVELITAGHKIAQDYIETHFKPQF